jgi:hypothetical protein
VVVVAPATAVAGAATTTPAKWVTHFLRRRIAGKRLAVGIFSLFSGTATHARSEKYIAERAATSRYPKAGADHA